MIVKLSKSYFNKYVNRIIFLLMNIQFISYEFAESICEDIYNNINLYSDYSFLYIDRDIPLGIIIASPLKHNILSKKACEIKYLSVNPDFSGRGIASSMVGHLKKKCSGYFDYLYLTVYENNSGAIEFYKKMGFSLFMLNGKLQTVVRDPGTRIEHTDICMTCDLTV
ncbi:MAG: N-acetyltransferase [Actinomycetota bacterium]|nr:N-acetyltransferase [Actinomycetota bacterium]